MKNRPGIEKINQHGSTLLMVIVAMVILAVAAAGMLDFFSTSTYGELLANRQQRAYYIAESGINYALSKFNNNPDAVIGNNYTNGPFFTPQTFKLSNGQFIVKTYDKPGDPTHLIVESTGIVESGWLTTRQLIYKDFNKASANGSTTDSSGVAYGFNEVAPVQEVLDPIWQPVPSPTEITVSEEGDLTFKGDQGAIVMNPAVIDLSTAYTNSDNLLSYFLQVKIDNTQMNPGNYYLIGLSFRVLDSAAKYSYGVSFYRSNGDMGPKTWWTTAAFADFRSKLPIVKNDKFYAVLWKRINGTFTVLAATEVDNQKYPGVITTVSNKQMLSPWTTLVIRVIEKKEPTRTNYLQAYIQVPSQYPIGTIKWNFSSFMPITWTQTWPSVSSVSPSEVTDSTITSLTNVAGNGSLYTAETYISRPEVGVHGFYDSSGLNSQIFADFATTIQGVGGGGSQW